jgi:hypothetical protein
MAAVSISWFDAVAYAPFDLANGIRLPPITATRRVFEFLGNLLGARRRRGRRQSVAPDVSDSFSSW